MRSPSFLLALVAAAILGAAVALAGAVALDIGDETTTASAPAFNAFPTASPPSEQERGDGETLSIQEIYRRAAPGVVRISSTTLVQVEPDPDFGFGFGPQTQRQRSLGSGFVFDEAGHILTNYHVVRQAESIEVSFSNNDTMSATVVGTDPATDIAVLKVKARSRALHPLELGNSTSVRVGDPVVAIGNPLGYDRSITAGIVSALQRQLESPSRRSQIDHVIQTDAQINKGNSGGPLLNARGEVIGVNSAIETADPGSTGNIGIGFAIPINTVKDVAAQLIKTGKVEHAYLGVRVQTIDKQIAELFGLPTERGVLVTDVEEGSAAQKAGIRGGDTDVVVAGESFRLGGDLIVEADGKEIASGDDLRSVVAASKPGDEITVELFRPNEQRDPEKLEIEVELGRQPASPSP